MRYVHVKGETYKGSDGRYYHRNPVTGAYTETQAPRKHVIEEPHPMTDPYERKPEEVVMIRLQRTVYMTVPDYEAEVLCRNGWEIVSG